jgi:hypothetical protein
LKACGLFTGAASKRNRLIAANGASLRLIPQQGLIRVHFSAAGVLFAQFIHQMRQVRRQSRFLRAEVLLQPFAHGIANRLAGLAVDLFAVVAGGFHDRVPLMSVVIWRNKSLGWKWFPAQIALRDVCHRFRWLEG